MTHAKKYYLMFGLLVAIAGILFFVAAKKAFRITVTPSDTPIIADQSVDIPIDDSDPMYGNPGSPITIVEFADIGCPRCLTINYTIKNYIDSKHQKDMRLVWKDAPRSSFISEGYALAHQAAQCAGRQNKFWQFLDVAMQNTNNLQEPGLRKIAEGLKLNENDWWQCTNSDETKQKISDSLSLAEGLQITTLPAVFINNQRINTDSGVDIKQLLDQYLQQQNDAAQNSSVDTNSTDLQTTDQTQTGDQQTQ